VNQTDPYMSTQNFPAGWMGNFHPCTLLWSRVKPEQDIACTQKVNGGCNHVKQCKKMQCKKVGVVESTS
jgi:hypothetical protein